MSNKNWKYITDRYKFGDLVSGIVTRTEPFGIFLDINGLTGFVRIVGITDEDADVYSHFPDIGATVNGVVVQLTEHNNQIVVSLRPSDIEAFGKK